mmetsp:Transcript_135836/g.247669  ORF Transcript_135836/g.247669 Transcript_135836/m.247669 type:complete len:128 (-) Transcript_135836:10-393(-)
MSTCEGRTSQVPQRESCREFDGDVCLYCPNWDCSGVSIGMLCQSRKNYVCCPGNFKGSESCMSWQYGTSLADCMPVNGTACEACFNAENEVWSAHTTCAALDMEMSKSLTDDVCAALRSSVADVCCE